MPAAIDRLTLVDEGNQGVGLVDSIESNDISFRGKFYPLAGFSSFKDLFLRYEFAVFNSLTPMASELKNVIDAIGLCVHSQTMPRRRVFSVRIKANHIDFRWVP
jgi:hypothetical protein